MRIRNILTAVSPRAVATVQEYQRRWSDVDVTVEVEQIRRGPYSLGCATEATIAGPYILEAVIRAEREGVDAIAIECMLDPAIRSAREVARIPVISSAKAGMAFAISLGTRVGVVSRADHGTLLEENLRGYGLWKHVCSLRRVDIAPGDLAEAAPGCFDRLVAETAIAIDRDGADVILLGCTAMSPFAQDLRKKLGVPVIEPSACAIRMAIDLVRLGLSHSKLSYPTPPERPATPGSISVWQPTVGSD